MKNFFKLVLGSFNKYLVACVFSILCICCVPSFVHGENLGTGFDNAYGAGGSFTWTDETLNFISSSYDRVFIGQNGLTLMYWQNRKLYFQLQRWCGNWGGAEKYGYFTGFYICNGTPSLSSQSQDTILQSCTLRDFKVGSVQNIINNLNPTMYYITQSNTCDYQRLGICYTDNEGSSSLCFYATTDNNNAVSPIADTINPLEINGEISPFLPASSTDAGSSYISSQGGSTYATGSYVINGVNYANTVYYFERQGFKKELCYVGINDLQVLYGSGGSFEYGSGKTIFDLYNSKYGTGSGSGYLDKVGVFINSWLVNYKWWFVDQERDCTFVYDNNTGQGRKVCGNITFPFGTQPTAVYFMASNLYDSVVNSKGNQGKELAVYCEYKLHGSSGTGLTTENPIYGDISNYLSYNDPYNTYQTQSGNNVYYITDISYSIPTSGGFLADTTTITDLDNGNTITFMTRVYSLIDKGLDFNYNDRGLLPEYIIVAFLFVLFIKLIRH